MIKFILALGIGFTPGSVKYIPTLGFSAAVGPARLLALLDLAPRRAALIPSAPRQIVLPTAVRLIGVLP